MGPRAWSFWVEMPISAPNPSSSPSTNRVDALTRTAAASTSFTKRSAARDVVGDDGLAVAAAVAGDVGDGRVEGVDDPHRELQVEELGGVVVVGGDGGHPIAEDLVRGFVADQLDALESRGHLAEEGGGDVAVDEQRLGGVAHRGALGLGVLHDGGRHRRGRRWRRRTRGSCRRRRSRRARWRCRGPSGSATARPAGSARRSTPRRRMNSTAASWRVSSTSTSESCGQPGLGQPLAERRRDGDVRADGARRPAEERGVARLQAQPEGVAGDVGAVLVDDRHHAERHPDPVHPQPVRTGPAVGDLADRVRQRGDGPEPVRPWRGGACR